MSNSLRSYGLYSPWNYTGQNTGEGVSFFRGSSQPRYWSQVSHIAGRFLTSWATRKMMPLKMLHSICQEIWRTPQWSQDWKRSAFTPIPKKGNAKECSNYCTIALISHTSKVMLKILQARLQHYMNYELPDVQARFRKGRGTRDQIANIPWIIEKSKRAPEEHLLLY